MIALALLVAQVVVLHYTAPLYRQVNCDTVLTYWPADVRVLRLYGWPRWSGAPILLREKPATDGQADTIAFDLAGGLWTLYVTTVGADGGESCHTASLTLPVLTSVPPLPVQGRSDSLYYDIAGRRLQGRPGIPGVYIVRVAGRRGKVVVLR